MGEPDTFLQAVRSMDEKALVQVFDLYAPVIYKYAFHYCRDSIAADEIVGIVFGRLLEQLSVGNGPTSNLRAYLYEIAYHSIIDEIRHSRRLAPIGTATIVIPAANNTDLDAEKHILLGAIAKMIHRELTEDQRQVILLRFMEGCNLKETAKIMGIKVNHVKVIQNRAVAALRAAMDDTQMKYKPVKQSSFIH